MRESIREDLYLFYNDLYEYQKSREGQQVARTHKRHQNGKATETELETALANFWDARNGRGLTWSNKAIREKAKQLDAYIAELYREQN